MERPSIVCAVINAIFVLFAAFIFLFYIFHESKGSDAKEMNREEIERFRHHRRILPASEHFTNISLIEQHYCPSQQADQCSIKAFSFCGNNSRTLSLTFDMNQLWTKNHVEGVIKELQGLDIRATFFITSQETIDHQDKCEQIKSLVQAGHEVQLMNWNGNKLHPDEPIEVLQIDDAMEFFSDCLGNSKRLPVQFRPIQGQITLDQARAVSQRHHMSIAMWSLSSEPDRVEHLLELAEIHLESNESIIIRCQDPEYWSQPGPLSVLVSYFYQEEQYEFISSQRCYQQCATELCLVPAPRSR